jgi:hypothetical protein
MYRGKDGPIGHNHGGFAAFGTASTGLRSATHKANRPLAAIGLSVVADI